MTVPKIDGPGDVPPGPLAWLRSWASKLALWVRMRDPDLPQVGSAAEKFTSRGELARLGILRLTDDGTYRAGTGFGSGGTTIIPGDGGGGGGGGGTTPDLTPPPTPTGLAGVGAISHILLSWDAPVYSMGHGHSRTIIYGAIWLEGDPAPTFGDIRTKQIDTAEGASTFHAYPTDPGTRWCIWIKWQTVDGVLSTSPAGGINGVVVATGEDPEALLKILSGRITASQLFTDLATTIGLLPVIQEDADAQALQSVLDQNAARLSAAQALAAEALDRGTAIAELRTVINTGDTQLAQLVSTVSAAVANNAAAVQSNSTAIASTNAALAAAQTALVASINGNTAAIAAEALVRADETGALFGQYSVKIDLGGFMTGWGLSSEVVDGTPISDFMVRADRISFVPSVNFSQESTPTATAVGQRWFKPSTKQFRYWTGSTWAVFSAMPFTVLTAPSTEGGVTLLPGTYIDAAYIVNLTATYARISSLVADDIAAAEISVAQLTGSVMRVGAYIQSTNYVSGVSGFRLNANGTAQLPAAAILGKLTVGQLEVEAIAQGSGDASSYDSGALSGVNGAQRTFTLLDIESSGRPTYIHATATITGVTSTSGIGYMEMGAAVMIDGTVVDDYVLDIVPTMVGIDGRLAVVNLPLLFVDTLTADDHTIGIRTYVEMQTAPGTPSNASFTWSAKVKVHAFELPVPV